VRGYFKKSCDFLELTHKTIRNLSTISGFSLHTLLCIPWTFGAGSYLQSHFSRLGLGVQHMRHCSATPLLIKPRRSHKYTEFLFSRLSAPNYHVCQPWPTVTATLYNIRSICRQLQHGCSAMGGPSKCRWFYGTSPVLVNPAPQNSFLCRVGWRVEEDGGRLYLSESTTITRRRTR